MVLTLITTAEDLARDMHDDRVAAADAVGVVVGRGVATAVAVVIHCRALVSIQVYGQEEVWTNRAVEPLSPTLVAAAVDLALDDECIARPGAIGIVRGAGVAAVVAVAIHYGAPIQHLP